MPFALLGIGSDNGAEFIMPNSSALRLLGHWTDTDEQLALSYFAHRLQRGAKIWQQAAELYYHALQQLRRRAQDQRLVPAICRFLQGNPYELQNHLMFEQLVQRSEQPLCVTSQIIGNSLA